MTASINLEIYGNDIVHTHQSFDDFQSTTFNCRSKKLNSPLSFLFSFPDSKCIRNPLSNFANQTFDPKDAKSSCIRCMYFMPRTLKMILMLGSVSIITEGLCLRVVFRVYPLMNSSVFAIYKQRGHHSLSVPGISTFTVNFCDIM